MSYILIVEDDPHIRTFLRVNLTQRKFQVIEAISGEEALNRIQSNPPELVLLDIMLPTMSGIDLLKILASDEQHKDLPVIIISAVGKEQANDMQSRFPQVAATIGKPLSATDLISTVRNIMDNSLS